MLWLWSRTWHEPIFVSEHYHELITQPSVFQAQLQSRHEKSAVLIASHYIVFNVAWNAILHILLWLVLTFYCWECTKVLSLTKLIYCFPVAIALWLLNFLFTIYVWKKSVKPILTAAIPLGDHHTSQKDSSGHDNWGNSRVYSTQLWKERDYSLWFEIYIIWSNSYFLQFVLQSGKNTQISAGIEVYLCLCITFINGNIQICSKKMKIILVCYNKIQRNINLLARNLSFSLYRLLVIRLEKLCISLKMMRHNFLSYEIVKF